MLFALLASPCALAEEQETDEVAEDETAAGAAEQIDRVKSTRTLTGISVLGNEETPKSLVIVPWKSSEFGDDVSLTDTLDDRALPIDKEIFLRELRFYEIRSQEK